MESIVIPLVALSIPIVVAPTALAFRHAKLVRELEHRERMAALELGRTLPQDEQHTNPAGFVVAIGVVVPLAALLTAFLASGANGRGEVWQACGLIGIAGMACGTYLANRYLFPAKVDAEPAQKRVYDPDSFDVVSRRG